MHWIQQKLQTWEGVAASIIASATTIWGMMKLLPKLLQTMQAFYEGAKFTLEIREHHEAMRVESRASFSKIDDQMVSLLQMHQHLLDSNPHPWFTANERGLTTWVNRKWRKITGLDLHEARGRGWENGIAPEDRTRVIGAWDMAITHERAFEELVTYMDRQGRRTKVHISATPNRRPDGTITGWMGHASFEEEVEIPSERNPIL